MMLANAVQYTAGTVGLEPNSGVLQIGESIDVAISIAAGISGPGSHGYDLFIESNDPSNTELTDPLSFEIEPPALVLNTDQVNVELYSNEIGQEEI